MFRIAVLGAGDVAERHIAGLLSDADVEAVTIVDPIAERAREIAAQYGFERTDASAEAAIGAEDVDLVVVLTPHHLHVEHVTSALAQGKHVICEKPLARNLAECDVILEAAEKSTAQLFVTHVLRTVFFFEKASERVDSGELGRLTLGSFRWYTDELPRLDDPDHWKGRIEESGGGVLIDGGCHVSDVGNWLFGRARRVQAFGDRLVASREDVGEDTVVFNVEYASGAVASVALTFVAGSGLRPHTFACGMDVDIYGTEGHLEGGYRFRDGDQRHYCTEHKRGQPDTSYVDSQFGEYGDIDLEILRALRGEAAPPLTAVEARNAVAVVEAAYRSLREGKSVDVDWREE